ncbi:MAG: M81 family peptidase [Betaproteobacteria bacterium]|jgi:microcystin degradation protein MlrC|nr:M81 family metallopeptidase [Pseudomonadota bacterium]NBP36010.1 M81 family peptidase [Betaproteobacteria bacterium]NBP38771.1 M81 family peptidase [Betaproteobacteria bacterium]NBQ79237.1 M81 family peptidase [Betaproteobacteria bacterium]NBQ96077.1 M81 family peptidase [Betaproteobacteria bacterium]
MARIAIGGMQHETNTFAPTKASYLAFEQGGGWPGIQRGDALFAALEGANIPAQGAIEAFRAQGHQLLPLTWAAASPSAHVTQDAFESIVGDIERGLRDAVDRAEGVDAVYLDLHGAMVTEDHEDGEGEILRRVRSIVGARVPVVASLDLHANVTKAMVEHADAMSIYRTYPHVDMAETGARAAFLAMQMLATGKRPIKRHHAFSYLTGIPSQCTFIEPGKSLYELLGRLEQQHGCYLSFAPGFPMADIHECGMSVIAYGFDAGKLDQAMNAMVDAVESAEKDFALELFTPQDAIQRAMQLGSPGRPVIIADTQDNPGAGGNGDTTGMLEALLALKAQDACLGLLIDPLAAERAHEAGQGASLAFELGATSGLAGHQAVRRRFTVERLGDGRFTCTGPMFKGFRMQLGKMALLRHEGVRVAVASIKCQAADQAMFRHLGVEPIQQRLMVLKSSVHFRADFQPIAAAVIVARSPGPALADPAEFAWTKLRPGVRLHPLGKAI